MIYFQNYSPGSRAQLAITGDKRLLVMLLFSFSRAKEGNSAFLVLLGAAWAIRVGAISIGQASGRAGSVNVFIQ